MKDEGGGRIIGSEQGLVNLLRARLLSRSWRPAGAACEEAL